ncbi:hypothetical protein BJ878DRAFT_416921 [Calycina marina]|uniref:DUF726-domain-containing protein n=1 Tax=Calycina marina TaxID=1763456 RepID=A0A9P8CIG9_9HELO|nr:hypothetical protein BJ878DRAFT_416921 [Calycina marina]
MAKDHGKEAGHSNDFSSILTANERVEITLLVANISECMRAHLLSTFDASLNPVNPDLRAKPTPQNPNVEEKTADEITEDEKEAKKSSEQREKELSAPKMLELRKDLLDFFDKWRESVLGRVGTAVNNLKEVAGEQKVNAEAKVEETKPTAEVKVINSNTNIEEADAALVEFYPPIPTALNVLPKDRRLLLLHAMLLLLLSLEHYSSYSRILLLHVASSLNLPLHVLSEDELKVAQGLLEAAKQMGGKEETSKRSDDNKVARRWKVGLASVAGAAIIGVTGGLAAPLVAGAIGTIMGGLGLGATTAAGLLGALAESGVVVGSLFGAYGGRMTGKMMDAYAKEVEDFAFLPLKGSKHHEPLPKDRRLRVTIGISGWLTQKEDVITPWRALGRQSEVFALRWELEALTKLGSSMETMWPITLLKVSKVIDNPFSVAKSRAQKAGQVLADALINRAQGERPVTLIGYSLGARLIYSCLMSLAERRAFGLVESAVLIGTPAPSDAAMWRAMRSVVAGRLINVYSENDYILAFLYRTSSIQYGVAGLQETQYVKGIENINVSEMVSGHLRYQYLVGSILEKIGFEDIDVEEVQREEETLALLEEEEKKEYEKKKGEEYVDPEKEAVQMEADVQKKSEKTMTQKAEN